MKKLTKLTKKQLAELPIRVKKWIEITTSGATDEVKARAALVKTYKRGGLELPKVIIFLDSPIKCLLGRYYAAAYLDFFLGRNKKSAQVDDQVGTQVDAQVGAQVRAQGKNIWQWYTFSIWWCAWLAYQETLCEFAKLHLKTDGIRDLFLARASWVWCYPEIAIICRMPKIARTAEGRLHNEHGMAIRYPDGYGFYYLNGVHFPEDLYKRVISREMEMKDILAIEDIDQRVQAMKFAKNGLREFYQSEGGQRIDHYVKLDKEGRPINYELWKIPAGKTFNREVHFAIYDCPSARERGEQREYAKGVPAFKTVAECMAWGMSDDTHALTPEEWEKLTPLIHES